MIILIGWTIYEILLFLSFMKVYPSSGPVAGGTLITITGHSIGNHDNDVIIVDIDGANCNNVTILIDSNR